MANPQLPGTMIVDGPQSPWEAALAKYQQALVDLDGDGIPDGVMTPDGRFQPLNNDIRRAISQQALAGREPAVDMARIGRRAQTREENNQAVEEGVGDVLLGQPVKAVNAMLEAAGDPSIANVTNAGVQSALVVPTTRPAIAAAKMGAAGIDAAMAARAQGAAAREQAAAARVPDAENVINAFVQQNGRLPTKAEFEQLNSRTLPIPVAAGAAAGPVNDMLNYYQR